MAEKFRTHVFASFGNDKGTVPVRTQVPELPTGFMSKMVTYCETLAETVRTTTIKLIRTVSLAPKTVLLYLHTIETTLESIMKRIYSRSIMAICTIALVACTSRADRAAKYNDSIITRQRAVIEAFERMDSVFRDTNATKESVDYHYADLQRQVKLSLLALDSIGPFQQDPSLQLAAKDLFRTYEHIVDKDYRTLKGIKLLTADQITQEIADSSLSIQSRVHLVSTQAQEKFLMTQMDFGKKNNLVFE